MPLSTEKTKELVIKFGANEHDSGSPKVQVALLTERINQLNSHFKINKKDHHGRRGLLKMVSNRRRLMTYLKRTDMEGYNKLIKDLELRR